jgi:Tol biopolymer transport system component
VIGRRVAHYEIVERIGAGGMGEVYRARDTTLGRDVALKFLPAPLASDAERLAQLRREGKLLASLSHPNIAAIFGLEDAGADHFLVLELVPGASLAERLRDGPLPVAQVLEAGLQICDALAAAHGQNLIHRDLKPGNVMLRPDGRVIVLDFGLAKALASGPAAADGAGAGGAAATSTAAATATATSIGSPLAASGGAAGAAAGAAAGDARWGGTPLYMSPEQIRGRAVDTRTDLWSLGCVLYECLTGHPPFHGASVMDILGSILSDEPEWGALPADAPASLRTILIACLHKPADRRIQTARALREQLHDARDQLQARSRSATATVRRLVQVTFADAVEGSPTWSPDGRELVYTLQVGRVRKLMRKNLETGETQQITHGEHDDWQPRWTPDGAQILFTRAREAGRKSEPGDVFGGHFEEADVWCLGLVTGRENRLIENAYNPAASPDGERIAVDASWAGPRRIWMVDRSGRNPLQITTDTSEAVTHVRPRWSPDGQRIVFQNIERTQFDLRVVDVRTRDMRWLTRDLFHDTGPEWSPCGRFVYFTSAYRSGGLNVWRVPVSPEGAPAGPLQQITSGAGQDVEVAVAPDGRKLAFSILRQHASIWRLPVSPETGIAQGAPEKLVATTREDSRGAWSPDCRLVAFNSDRSGDMNLWVQEIAGGGVTGGGLPGGRLVGGRLAGSALPGGGLLQITRGPGGDYQPNWSPDGRTLAFFSSRNGNPGIWTVDLDSLRLRCLSPADCVEVNPSFSLDGGRIAYQSDRDGRLEVWVMNADGSAPRQLTRIGVMGHFLRWTGDAHWIVFRSPGQGKAATYRIAVEGGAGGATPEQLPEVIGGSHMSFSPDSNMILDVLGHRTVWVSPLDGRQPWRSFEFDDAEVRIDYPVWSPDGRWVLFDRFRPEGGDIWVAEGVDV